MPGLGASFLPKWAPAGPGAALGTPGLQWPLLSKGSRPAHEAGRQAWTEQPLGLVLQPKSPTEVLMPGVIGSVPCSMHAVSPCRG